MSGFGFDPHDAEWETGSGLRTVWSPEDDCDESCTGTDDCDCADLVETIKKGDRVVTRNDEEATVELVNGFGILVRYDDARRTMQQFLHRDVRKAGS